MELTAICNMSCIIYRNATLHFNVCPSIYMHTPRNLMHRMYREGLENNTSTHRSEEQGGDGVTERYLGVEV